MTGKRSKLIADTRPNRWHRFKAGAAAHELERGLVQRRIIPGGELAKAFFKFRIEAA
ncbi:hypothetical protein [Salinisphaera sp. T5B8]|uniref:hypothetical protein n=1 Tax=Salinisphaera sp. T5B8 TaxID=1304154 RepID=UPI003341F9C7